MSQKAMRSDLRTLVLADATISALIAQRFYSSLTVAGPTMPYLAATVVGREIEYNHDGPENWSYTRIQFDAIAETVSASETLRDALVARLSGYSGTVGDTIFNAVFETGTEIDEFDDVIGTGGQPAVHRKIIDFRIAWQPA